MQKAICNNIHKRSVRNSNPLEPNTKFQRNSCKIFYLALVFVKITTDLCIHQYSVGTVEFKEFFSINSTGTW